VRHCRAFTPSPLQSRKLKATKHCGPGSLTQSSHAITPTIFPRRSRWPIRGPLGPSMCHYGLAGWSWCRKRLV